MSHGAGVRHGRDGIRRAAAGARAGRIGTRGSCPHARGIHGPRAGDTLVHLVGTPHPSPAKAAEFRTVDLPSILASVRAARHAGAAHVIYVSVAQPAPMMHASIAVRAEGEAALAASGLTTTVLRPWYVLGPGHWWPLALVPLYAIARPARLLWWTCPAFAATARGGKLSPSLAGFQDSAKPLPAARSRRARGRRHQRAHERCA